jgi:hypothetical protein
MEGVIRIGIVAAIPIALCAIWFAWLRAEHVQRELATESSFANMSQVNARLFWMAVFGLLPFPFGILASFLYAYVTTNWHWSAIEFTVLGVTLAFVMSLLAALSKTPLRLEKIVGNLLYGVGFGILIPLLAQ